MAHELPAFPGRAVLVVDDDGHVRASVHQLLAKTWIERVLEWTGQDVMSCPRCQGPLTRRELLDRPDRGATFCRAEPTAAARQTVAMTNSS